MEYKNYWNTLLEWVKKEETNDFVYKRWFGVGGLDNFKQDLMEYPSNKHMLSKLDSSKPFCPTNYKWVKKPKMVIKNPRLLISKSVYTCYTLTMTVLSEMQRNRAGLYKLAFSNGCFYIGSSGNITKRISCWVGTFNGTSKTHNKNVIKCVANCDTATFEVLQYVEDLATIKDLETIEIGKHIGNPLLLNRSHDANSNKNQEYIDCKI